MENVLNTRNDELVLLYINHALENLKKALILLRPSENDGLGDIEVARSRINESIVDNDLNYYLNNSTTLTAQEIFAVKKWFNKIRHVIGFVNRQSFNPQELQSGIPPVLSDQDLLAVKDRLEKELSK